MVARSCSEPDFGVVALAAVVTVAVAAAAALTHGVKPEPIDSRQLHTACCPTA